jgi:hypothetical protein
MGRQVNFFLIVFFSHIYFLNGRSQTSDSTVANSTSKDYSFIIQDSPAKLFTMRQFNQDYLSGYRLLSSALGRNFNPTLNYLVQTAGYILFFGPLTHEEAHRSILISKNIGAISQPFFLSKRGGYIDGVTDAELKHIRDTDFPDFARLHTAGLESDYMLVNREEALLSFENESYKNIVVEYLLRKAMLMQYYLIGFVHYDIDGAEEKNELKRDIVGNDVYGMVRHWFRPTMDYKRYTLYNELTGEEKNFVRRMGFRSFINLINANIIGVKNFSISNNLKMNFGMGYTMSPFGDFIDETTWFKCGNDYKLSIYLREFQNKNNWFLGGGIGIYDLMLSKRIGTNINAHIWDQPQNLGFIDTKGQAGGAVEVTGRYFLFTKRATKLKNISFDLGLILKTKGFLPEEIYLGKHIGFRLGVSFGFDQ